MLELLAEVHEQVLETLEANVRGDQHVHVVDLAQAALLDPRVVPLDHDFVAPEPSVEDGLHVRDELVTEVAELGSHLDREDLLDVLGFARLSHWLAPRFLVGGLACAEGGSNTEIAQRLGIDRNTVGKWRRRFLERRLDGLWDEPRPGAPRTVTDDDVERVIVKTLEETPANATHWSTRSMAAATGMSQSAVSRIWRAFALKPHRVESFKLSPDPQFIEKVRDIVGLYVNPPDAAVVLCVDEKSQIQALDRTAPVFPLLPGTPERRTHDYVRNGTTNLYAALDVASGNVIADLTPRHRSEEFRRFLNLIDRNVPARPRRACHRRQLLDPQVADDSTLARASPAFHPAFHTDLQLVAEPRRTLVRGTHSEVAEAGNASLDPTTRRVDTHVDRALERRPATLRVHKTADEILDNLAAYCQRISDSNH